MNTETLARWKGEMAIVRALETSPAARLKARRAWEKKPAAHLPVELLRRWRKEISTLRQAEITLSRDKREAIAVRIASRNLIRESCSHRWSAVPGSRQTARCCNCGDITFKEQEKKRLLTILERGGEK